MIDDTIDELKETATLIVSLNPVNIYYKQKYNWKWYQIYRKIEENFWMSQRADISEIKSLDAPIAVVGYIRTGIVGTHIGNSAFSNCGLGRFNPKQWI